MFILEGVTAGIGIIDTTRSELLTKIIGITIAARNLARAAQQNAAMFNERV
jgi:hypothetical protein